MKKCSYLVLALWSCIVLQSCINDSPTDKSNQSKAENPGQISVKRSEGTIVNNEMSHWIGTYRFTDSPMTSVVRYPKQSANANRISSDWKLTPIMELKIFEQNSKLVGLLKLKNVQEERSVNVVVNGDAEKVGVYYISSNDKNASFEKKGDLLFTLRQEKGILITNWSSWYPLNARDFITSGFIKDEVR